MTYAAKTSTSPERTKNEIERVVTKHGAVRFMSGWEDASATVAFEMRGRRVRFKIAIPPATSKEFAPKARHVKDTRAARERRHEQSTRSRWRALYLVIKAKLEAVAAGVEVFEEAFLAQIIIPGNGQTIGEWVTPELARVYGEAGSMPPLLPGGEAKR